MTYKNGTIVLIGNRKWGSWLSNLVTGFIVKATKSNKIHIKRYLDGYWYESSYPKGAGKTTETFVTNEFNLVREPITPFTNDEVIKMVAFAEESIVSKMKYNLIKLILLYVILPTRKFWECIHWVPFSNNKAFGTVCSVFDAEMVRKSGRIEFNGDDPEMRTPGDYERSTEYRDI